MSDSSQFTDFIILNNYYNFDFINYNCYAIKYSTKLFTTFYVSIAASISISIFQSLLVIFFLLTSHFYCANATNIYSSSYLCIDEQNLLLLEWLEQNGWLANSHSMLTHHP